MPIGRREFVHTLAAGALNAQTRLRRRPNVLLIMAETVGYGDLSLHGNPTVRTTTVDRLAAESTELTRFYVSPTGAPTRASLLTGRYSVRCGVHGESGGRETLPAGETTIAKALRLSGYRTAHYGRWGLGAHYPNTPPAMGFDEYIGLGAAPGADAAGALTAQALRFLEERHEPFFLYLTYNPPPVGPLLVRLERLGISEDTIVIFLSDCGPAAARFNSGLRGLRGSTYEGGSRVPFLIRWPGHITAGRRLDTIAAHIDLYPTLLELCRAPQPDSAYPIDGRPLTLLLTEERTSWPDRPLFCHAGTAADPSAMYPGTIRTQRFNLVDGRELYEIPTDPGEEHDLAAQHPDVAAHLRAVYDAWFRSSLPRGGFRRSPVPVGFAEENPVALSPAEGTASGEMLSAVRWDLDVSRGGRFQASMRYRCPAASLGQKVEVRAGRAAASTTIAEPAATLTVGTLELPAGAARLELRALTKTATLPMEMEQVILRRL